MHVTSSMLPPPPPPPPGGSSAEPRRMSFGMQKETLTSFGHAPRVAGVAVGAVLVVCWVPCREGKVYHEPDKKVLL